MLKNIIYIQTLAAAMSLAACSGDDATERAAAGPVETVRLCIAVPEEETTRIGDPGSAVEEGRDWNRLAVMLEYTDKNGTPVPGDSRVVRFLSKEDFESLPALNGNSGVRVLSVNAEPGDAYIYGVTFTGEAWGSPEAAIGNCRVTKGRFDTITISNDYAEGDAAKFVSVATGYYKADDGSGDRAVFAIKQSDGGALQETPVIRLTRLATKIDIQWDASDAYPEYNNVEVAGFTFHNDNAVEAEGSGAGRLFPALAGDDGKKLPGSKMFRNQTYVSRRNGRVYHYVFPDGKSKPKVVFRLSADEVPGGKEYTFNFGNELRNAAWYKINTTIKGLNNENTDFSVSFGE